VWASAACRSSTIQSTDLIEGTVVTGASKMHELIAAGAATLSF
jgi:hypothetical protein